MSVFIALLTVGLAGCGAGVWRLHRQLRSLRADVNAVAVAVGELGVWPPVLPRPAATTAAPGDETTWGHTPRRPA